MTWTHEATSGIRTLWVWNQHLMLLLPWMVCKTTACQEKSTTASGSVHARDGRSHAWHHQPGPVRPPAEQELDNAELDLPGV